MDLATGATFACMGTEFDAGAVAAAGGAGTGAGAVAAAGGAGTGATAEPPGCVRAAAGSAEGGITAVTSRAGTVR